MEVMNLKEATEFLKFKDENFTRAKCRKKEIPCRKIGGEYRFSREALIMWLAGMNLEEIYKKMAEKQLEKAMLLMP